MHESTTSTGRRLAELMRMLELDIERARAPRAPACAANDTTYVTADEFYRVCQDGERTAHLTRIAGSLVRNGLNVETTTALCTAWNARNDPPLGDEKIASTVASIARTHARNHPEDDPDTPLFDLGTASVARFVGKAVPEREWVLKDCLPLGKTTLLVAPGGTGKSQLVLQLMYDIATGTQCHSPWAPGKSGEVLMIGAEDDEEEVHRRFERLARSHAGRPEYGDLLAARDRNMYIVTRVSENNLLTVKKDREVARSGLVEQIVKTVAPLKNLRLIVLDPVARFRGGDENVAEDATRFIEAAESLVKQTGAALLLVHHTNKASMRGADQDQSAARGSSALTDGARLQINLSYPSVKDLDAVGLPIAKYVVATITKTNYSAAGEPIYLRRDDEGRLIPVDVDEAAKSREQSSTEKVAEILRSQAAAGREYSKSTFAELFGGKHGPFGVGQDAVKSIVARAIACGAVEVLPGKLKTLRAGPPPPEPVPKAKVRLPGSVAGEQSETATTHHKALIKGGFMKGERPTCCPPKDHMNQVLLMRLTTGWRGSYTRPSRSRCAPYLVRST